MFSSAEKTTRPATPIQAKSEGGKFFRKAGEGFFSHGESQSESKGFFSAPVQAKLEVSHPDDPQEKEADHVAAEVMRMPDPVAAAASSPAGGAGGHGASGEATAGSHAASAVGGPSGVEEELQCKEDEDIAVHAKQDKEEEIHRSAISPAQSIGVQRKSELEEKEKVHAKLFGLLSRQAGGGGFASHGASEEESGSTQVQAKAYPNQLSTYLMRSARGPPAPAASIPAQSFEHSLSSSKGSGGPLPDGTRQSMESRFGADFSGVRIHTGSHAENLSGTIQAQAFTHGNDIYFNSGKFSPNTAAGSTLLAHELTHTIQQGASHAKAGSLSAKSIQRKISRSIQRVEATTQRNAAVEAAKAEPGKVVAHKLGPDGKRMGWERLLEYFKAAFGADKILPDGAAYQPGCVTEAQIKTPSTFNGDVTGPGGTGVVHNQPRDAMPSWCGIFAFWALNKGGIPVNKWKIGGTMIPPQAAYPGGYQPQAGDIAYRREYSHYALVASADGANVTSINGNTSGSDNVGGEIQVQTHPKDHWAAYFNPTLMMEGALRNPGAPDAPAAAPARKLKDMRKGGLRPPKVLHKGEAPPDLHELDEVVHAKRSNTQDTSVQAKAEDAAETGADGTSSASFTSSEAAAAPASTHAPAATNTAAAAASVASGSAPAAMRSAESVPQEKSEEQDHEQGTSTSLGFSVHRSAESAKHNAAQSLAAPAREADQSSPATTVQKKENVRTRPVAMIQRQAKEMRNRGPPRAPPMVQAMVNRKLIQAGWLSDAWDAVSGFVSEAAEFIEEGLDAAKNWILGKIRDFVANIKGYKMLCFILGEDPIAGTPMERNGANLLEAGLDLVPFGDMFLALMRRLGIFNDVAGWLQGRIDDLTTLVSSIGTRLENFIDGLSLSDIGDPQGVLDRVGDLLRGIIQDITDWIVNAAVTFISMIKRVMVREIAGFVRRKTPHLYPLLCVALGFDPETMVDVPRNGTNILNALLEVSEQGREQRRQMQETGSFQKVVKWIDEGISVFSRAYTMLKAAIAGIWDAVTSIQTLVHPIATFERIWNSFAAPVLLVGDFIWRAGIEILKLIKEALLSRLSAWARPKRGYFLICVIIGRDVFTGHGVERSIENIIHGFMSLMDGGEQQFEQMKQTGAIDKIVDKIHAAVARLNMTPASIIKIFTDLWSTFSLTDLIHPVNAFMRIVDAFAQPVLRLVRFVIEIVIIVIEAILIIMKFPFDIVANIIAKARQAWDMIKADPVGFFKNLLAAIKQGFIQFFDNIGRHLLNGIVGWLMSELKDAGVPILSDFSLQGVISWILKVLGISMEKIWEKLAAHPRIGPEKVAKIRSAINTLEGIWTFIKDVQERGIEAVWDKIQEKLSNLWDTVLDAVKAWIMDKIIGTVTAKLLSMLDPTGIMAVVNSAIAIYKAIQSAIKYLTEMLMIVNSFVEGIVEIASGNLTRSANAIENAMDQAMPVVIGFLANQCGLSGLGSRVAELVGRAQQLVDEALTWLVNKCVDTAFALLDKIMAAGRSAVAAVKRWLGIEQTFQANDGSQHKVYMGGSEDSPVLMVASNPTAYADFLASVQVDPADTKRVNAKAAAQTIAANIDQRKASNVPGETPDQKKAAVQVLLGDLAVQTKELFGDPNAAGEPDVQWPSQHGPFGMVMTASKLNKAQKLTGSAPTSSANAIYSVLNQRKDEGNPSESYYVKGHLLNESIGGKGNWNNLTPLSRAGNSAHESMVESLVKAAFHSGAVVMYNVTAVYGGYGGNAASIPSTDPQASEKLAIIAQESNVPTSLHCEAYTMEKTGGQFTKKDPIVNTDVPNVIGQTADTYAVSGTSTVKSYADLVAEATPMLAGPAPMTWAAYQNQDRVHRDSIAALTVSAPADLNALKKLFDDHFRAADKAAELASVAGLAALTDIQTWTAFKGGRSFYSTADAMVDEVKTAFDLKQASLRGQAFTAAEAAAPLSAAGTLWRDFKTNNNLNFKIEDTAVAEKARLTAIQTAFEAHQNSFP